MTPETNHDVEISIYHDFLEDQGIIVDRDPEEQDQWTPESSYCFVGIGMGICGIDGIGGIGWSDFGSGDVGGGAGGRIGGRYGTGKMINGARSSGRVGG